MRIRLLMDTVIIDEEISRLAELIADQPAATIQIDGYPLLGARFMAAQPVAGGDEETMVA
jgi:hypothetical protein